MAEAAQKIERDVQIGSGRLKLSGQTSPNNRWSLVLTPEMTRDDLFVPRFWSHIAVNFTPGDIVEIRFDDGSYYGEFYVTDCSRIHVSVKELRWVSLEDEAGKSKFNSDEFEYKWRGPQHGHCAVRVADGEPVIQGLASKAEVQKWIAVQ